MKQRRFWKTLVAVFFVWWSTCHAEQAFHRASCEFTAAFPVSDQLVIEGDTTRTPYEALPFLSAKCSKCPKSCRTRRDIEDQLKTALIEQYELKDYSFARESPESAGFAISGVTYKENSETRIRVRVLFGDQSIFILSVVEPVANDGSTSTKFLASARRGRREP